MREFMYIEVMIWVTAILEDIDTRAILPRYEDSCMVHTSKGY